MSMAHGALTPPRCRMPDTAAAAITIVSVAGSVRLSTQDAIYTEQARSWQRRALRSPLDLRSVQRSVAVTSDGTVYIGTNLGEWGGKLWRVSGGLSDDRSHATTTRIAPQFELPITGVVRDPENAACVIASMGLRHMFERGGILRVCADSAALIFDQRCPNEGTDTVQYAHLVQTCRLAVFAVAPAQGGFWGVTLRELLRFQDHQIAERLPMPSFKNIGGIPIAVVRPGLVIVRTNVNWSVSLSGPTPLIPLEPVVCCPAGRPSRRCALL